MAHHEIDDAGWDCRRQGAGLRPRAERRLVARGRRWIARTPALGLAGLVLAFLLPASAAYGQAFAWTPPDTIREIEVAASGIAWIRLTGGPVDCSAVGGPSAAQDLVLKNDDTLDFHMQEGAPDRIYRTALTALAARSTVRFRFTGSRADARGNSFCVVERMKIL